MCRSFGIPKPFNISDIGQITQLYVDDRHGLLFCEVPKVGCTNWKKLLLYLTHNYNYTEAMSLSQEDVHMRVLSFVTPLARFNEYGRKYRLQNYLKFMMVRHPMERVVSAYVDKLEDDHDPYLLWLGKRILKKYRKNPSEDALKTGRSVTFQEFINYLLDETKTKWGKKNIDIHWRTYDNLCHPCSIDYDVIGKYETLETDSNNILDMIGSQIRYPSFNKSSKTATFMDKYYKQLSPGIVQKIWELYRRDAEIYGYDYSVKQN
ncbi:carbohydrate sulfotransferase 11 isoform X2 [Lingula anatina]|nr:carbohydrate sulfotransferase 11 isoform X2 [Lingula anatina]|eukprot:XP_013394955.1 carbohydrate sulfotransferase 11 isoform X2 [Lingula anatina]